MESFNLDIIPRGTMPACHSSQFDVNRTIRVYLLDNGQEYTLDGTETLTLSVRKPDNTVITATLTGGANHNYVDFSTTEQMTAIVGQSICEIRIEKGETNIGTLNFVLEVEKDPLSSGIHSESVITDLQAQVDEAVAVSMNNYYTKSETDALLSQKADESELLNILPTDNASGAVASFTDGADNVPVKALSVEFAASQASGTPTPAAPIPIVGVDKVNVSRTGKNLCGGSKLLANAQAYLPNGTTDLDNKTFRYSTTTTATSGLSFTSGIKFKENTAYTFILSIIGTTGYSNLQVVYTDDTTANIPNPSASNTKEVIRFVSNANKTVKHLRRRTAGGSTIIYYEESGIFEGNISTTDYEPYNGTTALINLGGTYYGGSVDAVTGKITLTHGYVDLGTLNWSYFARNTRFVAILNNGKFTSSAFGLNTALCEIYPIVTVGYGSMPDKSISVGSNFISGSTCALVIHDEAYTTVNELTTALSGQHIVYELATPIVVYASNTAEIPTILGVNNFFSDAGDVDVTIRADIALYIQKMLGGNVNRSLGANPSILRTGAISTDIEVSEPVELEREVTEQPENEGNDNEER